MLVLEESCGTVAVAALALLHDFADKGLVDRVASHGLEVRSAQIQLYRIGVSAYLHHGKMLCAVVRLEQSISCPALDQDAAK